MKVLLLNPITSEKQMYTSTPNLGLAYIASSLRKNGFQVDLFDGMKKGDPDYKSTTRDVKKLLNELK